MRLGQLARKLALRPGEIIEFLSAQNIANEGHNTRLNPEHISLILQKFAPTLNAESVLQNEPDTEEETAIPPPTAESATEIPAHIPEIVVHDTHDIVQHATEIVREEKIDTPQEIVEVIKAPKVELPGLKVIGKIDLPEPKKKEVGPENPEAQVDSSAVPEEKKPLREPGRRREYSKNRSERPKKNPIAMKREHESREAKKKKQEEARLEKEKRTQNYLKKVKPAVPTKRARIIDEQVIEMEAETKPAPKTLLGKFWRWFRRE